MVEMPVPSVVMAATQTTATRDSSKPYSTSEAPSSSRANLVAAAVRGLVMEISPDGVDRVKGNKTPPTAQILLARLLKRMKVEFSKSITLSMLALFHRTGQAIKTALTNRYTCTPHRRLAGPSERTVRVSSR